MSTPTMLVHDYESFGVNPRRDLPAQFGAIRTDLDFNIIGDPIMMYCQPQLDFLPDPTACLITGITPNTCLERGIPEREFAAIIHKELSQPGTIGMGYNTIAFDDEITRFMFWRNLIEPYGREWQNGCGRWDLINVARAAYVLRPDGINWPKKEDGKPSFKLEDLAKANGLHHESAHDALSDVHATIGLAKLLKKANPKLFEYCFGMSNKARPMQEMDVDEKKPFIHISAGHGKTNGIALMMSMGINPGNKNEIIAWNLAQDPTQLLAIDAATMRARMFTKKEDEPEGFERLGVRTIASNKSPVVISNLAVLSADRAKELGIDIFGALANADKLRTVLKQRDMSLLFKSVYSREPEVCDVDEALYSGFLHNDDRRQLDRLRILTADGIASAAPTFRDPKLEELFFRFKARNFRQVLTTAEVERWHVHLDAKLVIGVHGSRTYAMLDTLVAERMVTADERQKHILTELVAYASGMASRELGLTTFLAGR